MAGAFLLATNKGVFKIAPTNTGWDVVQTSFLGDKYSLAMSDPRDGSYYAAADLGHFGVKVKRSTDGGASWTEIATPEYPEAPPGEPSVDPWGKPIPWKLVKIWALEPGPKSKPGEIWCGTIPGGLFRSNDYGQTWELNRPLWDHPGRKSWMGGGADLPGLHSVCVHPQIDNEMLIAVSCGGVWSTQDAGQNWENIGEGLRAEFMPPEQQFKRDIQDAHMMVQCPSAPDHLWIQHHNGIFVSSDRGQHFTEIPSMGPSVFGFAVVVHPNDPRTAWFIPGVKDECRVPKDGQLVVTRTWDGGKSCDVLTKGLPQHHAYDLVYRHGLDIDDTGNILGFGSTTGSFFVTEDGGDSWREVSAHLPPIFSVRWVRS